MWNACQYTMEKRIVELCLRFGDALNDVASAD